MNLNRLTRTAVALTVVALALSSVAAERATECGDAKSRQFDFWIGDWEVFSGDNLAGHNTIEPILDGCVLQESWRGAEGSAGSSLNFYNPQAEKWQQFWVWRNGTTLELEGAFADGKMVLEGESMNREGEQLLNRVTWYDNPDGTVRQHWVVSRDGGASWQTAFDGLYRKTP